jgi:hypothetical protein
MEIITTFLEIMNKVLEDSKAARIYLFGNRIEPGSKYYGYYKLS